MSKPDLGFVALSPGTPLQSRLVLRSRAGAKCSFARITHVFERTVYAMEISSAQEARNAMRPRRYARQSIEDKLKRGSLTIGTYALPPAFTEPLSDDSDRLKGNKDAIAPLLKQFSVEVNLFREQFSRRIADRADDLGMGPVSMRRILLRFWYFGEVDRSLLGLPRGRKPRGAAADGEQSSDPDEARRKPAGKQPTLAVERGANIFVIRPLDAQDMLSALQRCAKRGIGTLTDAHAEYLGAEFRKRHAKLYAQWQRQTIVVPVSYRRFVRTVKKNEQLSDSLREAFPALGERDSERSLYSSGPGDTYELDATGGQIFIVDSRPSHDILSPVTIYILVDRWSRYVVAVYATLTPPSSEGVRTVLRIAFTSRRPRFPNLGILIDDERWPPGVVPARLALDRGSDMIAVDTLTAATQGLHITPCVLPALTPDGKAIVERVIRTLKQKLKGRGLGGMYRKLAMDPRAKALKKRAQVAAVFNLQEFYRVLIEVVDEYNHEPHSTLRKRSILKAHRVEPTPVAAYLWGLKNLTGMRRPPLSDQDYTRLLLSTAKATVRNGNIYYRGRRYFPVNAAAHRDARACKRRELNPSWKGKGARRNSVKIAVDRSNPIELFTPTNEAEWPRWKVDQEGLENLQAMSLEEEEGLRGPHGLLHQDVEDKALAAKAERRRAAERAQPAAAVSKKRARSRTESGRLRGALTGVAPSGTAKTPTAPPAPRSDWDALESAEREEAVRRNARRRQ